MRKVVMLWFILLALSASLAAAQEDNMIDSFSGGDFASVWWSYRDDAADELFCDVDRLGYDDEHALYMRIDLNAGQYGGCGRMIESQPDASGLRFFWRADTPNLALSVTLDVGDVPFEAQAGPSGETWTEVVLPWNAFSVPDWAGDASATALDPALLVALDFNVGHWDQPQRGTIWIDALQFMAGQPNDLPADKFALWVNGPHLRGANIWQKVVIPEADGTEAIGPGPVGPPFTQEDFDQLAALGANYVNISHPGLFTVSPPFELDEAVQTNLDRLLEMIARADMFAVISFRTGPGRSEFTFVRDEVGDWFGQDLLIESVWEDETAKTAWAEMWQYTAERYWDNPIVVGYDLMVEPNAEEIFFGIYEPGAFYPRYAESVYDWNVFYPRLVEAIRKVDPEIPILVGGMGYSGVHWLHDLKPVDDPRMVYAIHQYMPTMYTYQSPPASLSYPGTFDADWDGAADQVNRAWLNSLLGRADDYMAQHGVPVAVNEFGVVRWVPGGAQFMDDLMGLFEERGINYALWAFHTSWPPFQSNDAFAIQHGPDAESHEDVETSALLEVIRAYWGRNVIRPSNASW